MQFVPLAGWLKKVPLKVGERLSFPQLARDKLASRPPMGKEREEKLALRRKKKEERAGKKEERKRCRRGKEDPISRPFPVDRHSAEREVPLLQRQRRDSISIVSWNVLAECYAGECSR